MRCRSLQWALATFFLWSSSSTIGFAQDCCVVFAPSPIPTLTANQIIYVPVTVTNTGDKTWPGYGSVEFLLSYFVFAGASPVAQGEGTLFPTPVAKGESATLNVRFQAPKNPGQYVVRWYIGNDDPSKPNYYYGQTTFDQSIEVNPSTTLLTQLLSHLAGSAAPPERIGTKVVGPLIISMSARSATEVTSGFHLGGQYFGNNAVGKVELVFPDTTFAAGVSYWTDRDIQGGFDVSGEPDQPAYIQITRGDGLKGNEWPVTFLAVRDYQLFPASKVQVQCATAWGTTNRCGTTQEYGANEISGDAAYGYHSSDCCIFGDSGSDEFTLPALKNGWAYELIIFHDQSFDGESAYSGFTPGSDAHVVTVNWSAPLHRTANYHFHIFVRGPKGLPY
jgi:hypothetical protein